VAENLRIPQRDLRGLCGGARAGAHPGGAGRGSFRATGSTPMRRWRDLSLAERQMAEIAMAFAEGGPRRAS
jgi:hypothetical protein